MKIFTDYSADVILSLIYKLVMMMRMSLMKRTVMRISVSASALSIYVEQVLIPFPSLSHDHHHEISS